MNHEGKFWCAIWAIVLLGIISIATVVTVDDVVTMQTIDNMVANGANPQEAACAIRQSEDNCLLAGRK